MNVITKLQHKEVLKDIKGQFMRVSNILIQITSKHIRIHQKLSLISKAKFFNVSNAFIVLSEKMTLINILIPFLKFFNIYAANVNINLMILTASGNIKRGVQYH